MKKTDKKELYLAPMEELTGYVFRNVLDRHFGYADKFFTPFISPDNRIKKTRSYRELIPANNEGLNVVPQLLTCDSTQFNEAAHLIADLGYEEININFGCPSNTVAGKFKGSGILRAPELMDRFLDGVFGGADSIFGGYPHFRISVKTRVGYNDTSDFEAAAKVFGRYPFSEIIIHPRIKKDLYNGGVRMEMFDMACDLLGENTDIVYNGDVFSAEDFEELEKRFAGTSSDRYKSVRAVMIGRGAVQDPGIFRQIRTGKRMTAEELWDFLNDLFETYKSENGAGNALAKLKEVWSYTVKLMDDEKERMHLLKMIMKAKNEHEYMDAVLVARGKMGSTQKKS